MVIAIGHVEALYRYSVKSMAGQCLQTATLGWHGIEGDRRLAFRRLEDRGGMPWLTASRLPELLLFAPLHLPGSAQEELPLNIRTPEGRELPVFGEELASDVTRRHGAPVQMMQLRNGIFDDASISVISTATIAGISQLCGHSLDARPFRPNIVIRPHDPLPFGEDQWVGSELWFGSETDAPAVSVTMRDIRCAMVNFHPDTAKSSPEVMKAVVRANQNTAGVYGTVTRTGCLGVGQVVYLRRAISI